MMNLEAVPADLIDAHATFVGSRALPAYPQQRIAVVGNGNSDVGLQTPTLKSGQPMVERLVSSGFTDLRPGQKKSSQREATGKCGAMSEQSADSGRGNEQVPQKLVHLVGTRDSSPRLPWVRPPGA
jgi:hypothetical protein